MPGGIGDTRSQTLASDDPAEQLLIAAESAEIGLWYLDFSVDKMRLDREILRIAGARTRHGPYIFFVSRNRSSRRPRNPSGRFLSETIRAGEQFEQQFRTILPDGNTEWIAAEGRSFLDKNGKPERDGRGCAKNNRRKTGRRRVGSSL